MALPGVSCWSRCLLLTNLSSPVFWHKESFFRSPALFHKLSTLLLLSVGAAQVCSDSGESRDHHEVRRGVLFLYQVH